MFRYATHQSNSLTVKQSDAQLLTKGLSDCGLWTKATKGAA